MGRKKTWEPATATHMEKNRKTALTSAAFMILAAIYFIPSGTLKEFLPGLLVRYRIAGPLAMLFLSGIFMAPWKITLAMGFSMTGDFMGAYGSFILQMSFFAMAHMMLIWHFAENLHSRISWKKAILPAILAAFALTCIIPHAPAGVIRTGCAIYAVLICSMLGLATCQSNPLCAAGAALFLFSDMILSWNKFVSPVPAQRWLIMVPYYAGQLLIWTSAVRGDLRPATRKRQ